MKKLYVAVFAFMLAASLSLSAGQIAKSVSKVNTDKNYDKGTVLIFTNLQGPNHHKYGPNSGYYVDNVNFNNQSLAGGFTPSSAVGFADAYAPFGVYTLNGGTGQGSGLCVTLNADSGGIPGAQLDPAGGGCLTQSNGVGLFPGNFAEFDCVTCPSLSAGTPYWIVGTDTNLANQFTWDFTRGLTDLNSPFAFTATNTGNVWTVIGSGFQRMAWEVDGF
jgi:hypothetical protein